MMFVTSGQNPVRLHSSSSEVGRLPAPITPGLHVINLINLTEASSQANVRRRPTFAFIYYLCRDPTPAGRASKNVDTTLREYTQECFQGCAAVVPFPAELRHLSNLLWLCSIRIWATNSSGSISSGKRFMATSTT